MHLLTFLVISFIQQERVGRKMLLYFAVKIYYLGRAAWWVTISQLSFIRHLLYARCGAVEVSLLREVKSLLSPRKQQSSLGT